MKSKFNLKKVGFVFAVPLSILVTSCGDDSLLKAVQNFAKPRETAEKTVTVIAEDFFKSCVRQYSFLPIEPIPTILQNETPYQDRIERLKKCNAQWEIGNDFEKANRLLLKYIASLEALSSDKVVIFPDTTKEKLENAINGLPFGGENDPNLTPERLAENQANREQAVKAGVGIFQFISRIFLNKYREDRLAEVIVETNDDVQTYTQILKVSVQRGYIEGYLQQEQANIDLYFDLIVTDIRNEEFPSNEIDPSQPPKKLAFSLTPFSSIDDQWREKRAAVEERIEIGRLYIQFLDEVAQGHNELYTLVKGQPPEGLPETQATRDEQKRLKELAKKRLERIQNIAQKLEKQLSSSK